MTATQYIKVPKAIVFMYELKKTAKRVLEFLTMRWDYLESKHKDAEEVYYNISQKRLAKDLNTSLRSISTAIRQLKELGLVKVRQHSDVDCTLDYIKTDITETEVFKSLDDDKKYLYEKESKSIEDTTTMPCEAPETPEKEVSTSMVDDDMVTLMGSTDYKFSQKQIQKLINIIKEKDSTLNSVEIITKVYRRMRDGGFKVKKWFSYLLKSVKTEIETEPVVEVCPQQAQSSTAPTCEKVENTKSWLDDEEVKQEVKVAEQLKERERQAQNPSTSETITIDAQLVVSTQLKIMQDYPMCGMTRDDITSLYKHIKRTLVPIGALDECDIHVYICQLCNRVIHNIKYKHTKITKMVAYMISIVNADAIDLAKAMEERKNRYIDDEDKPSYNLDAYIDDLHKYY